MHAGGYVDDPGDVGRRNGPTEPAWIRGGYNRTVRRELRQLLAVPFQTLLIFEPARRLGHTAVPGEDGVDLGHVGAGDGPAEGAQILAHLFRRSEPDERGAD